MPLGGSLYTHKLTPRHCLVSKADLQIIYLLRSRFHHKFMLSTVMGVFARYAPAARERTNSSPKSLLISPRFEL